ncbi:Histone H2A-Bbd type 2/3 [Saguinus oedipus]|uniref:Histone H2A n=1 Tax=Saguinus oedipus TaxID=9490 RepID=A0ABQ9TGB2_SAGOE|nr:Histone H2A-Bbd type 2/3 [Saguinus oedipus]
MVILRGIFARASRAEIGHPIPSMSERRSRRRSSAAGRRGHTRSRTARAELLFSVSQMECGLWEGHYAQRLSDNAPDYLAAVIQYLTAKILELAVDEADNGGERIITPRMLQMAILNDVLLSTLFRSLHISQVAPGPN